MTVTISSVNDDVIDGTQSVTITASADGFIGDSNVINITDVDDLDGDGIARLVDNCPFFANADQANFDGDSLGDICDSDDDNDGLPDTFEINNGLNPFNSLDAQADADADGFTNLEEFGFGSDPNEVNTDNNNDEIPDGFENNRPTDLAPIFLLLLSED